MPMKKGPDGVPFEVPTDLHRAGQGQESKPTGAEPAQGVRGRSPTGLARDDPNEAPTRPSWRTNSGAESSIIAQSERTDYAGPTSSGARRVHPQEETSAESTTQIYRPPREGARKATDAETERGSSASSAETARSGEQGDDAALPVGWLVVTDGPGRGKLAPLFHGWNRIGRAPDLRNHVVLNFGDNGISSEDHAAIVYDEGEHAFHLTHRDGRNGTYLNGGLVLSPTAIEHGQTIRISRTTLRFVRLCGPDFSW